MADRLGDRYEDAARVAQIMQDLGVTQQEAAAAAGIRQPNFAAFLANKRKLPTKSGIPLLDFFGQRYEAKRAADAVSRKRLTSEQAEHIREKAKKSLSSPLTFEQAKQMPLDRVMEIVSAEIESSSLHHLMQALDKSATPEKYANSVRAQLLADPRVEIAGAKAWIKSLEKERDDLQRQLLEANKELLSVYRRIAELEKVTDEELVAIVAPVK